MGSQSVESIAISYIHCMLLLYLHNKHAIDVHIVDMTVTSDTQCWLNVQTLITRLADLKKTCI
jgi:hypothetical protein